jgi:hypothetical protein
MQYQSTVNVISIQPIVRRFEFDIRRRYPLGIPIPHGLHFIGVTAVSESDAIQLAREYLNVFDSQDGNFSDLLIRRE